MGGKGSAPPPPDYVGAANAQAAASREVTDVQNYANRPAQYTPFGSTTWSTQAMTDPATGAPVTQWTQSTQLAPGLQAALDAQIGTQLGRSQLAGDFMGRVANEYSQPFDWSGMPQRASLGGPAQLNTQMTDYVPGLQTGINFDTNYRDRVATDLMTRMQPIHERQQNQLETKLANQGFRVGTEGYKRALDEMQARQAGERYNALESAGQEAQRLFNMEQAKAQFGNQALGQASGLDIARMNFGNQALQNQFALNQQAATFQNMLRQQAIAEEAQRRGMSLNEMNALLTGQQVGMPQMPSFNTASRSETPNILGATQMGYDAQLGAYNAQQAQNANTMGGLFQLGAAAAPFMFSDRRLKRNIKRIGTHASGVGIYSYTIMGYPQQGVIAQELQQVRPDLVKRHASGYLMVNYGGL